MQRSVFRSVAAVPLTLLLAPAVAWSQANPPSAPSAGASSPAATEKEAAPAAAAAASSPPAIEKASADKAGSTSMAVLETVVITAEKRRADAQKTSLSVQTFA